MSSVTQSSHLNRRKTGKGVQEMKGKMMYLGILLDVLDAALEVTCDGRQAQRS